MTADDTASPVIERLIAALCDQPRAVELTARSLPGRVNWILRADVNDMPKIVGMNGCRIRVLQLAVELMGKAAGEQWALDYASPSGERHDKAPDTPAPRHHSTAPDLTTLHQVLASIGIVAAVTVAGDVESGFTFSLRPSRHEDNDRLQEKHTALYVSGQLDCKPLNLLMGLGTVFRSIGRRQGVRYQIKLPNS